MLLFFLILITAAIAEGQNVTECAVSNCLVCYAYDAYHSSCYRVCTEKDMKKKCTCNCPENCLNEGGSKKKCPKSSSKSDKVQCNNNVGGCFVKYDTKDKCETAKGNDTCYKAGNFFGYYYYIPCSKNNDCKILECKNQGKTGSKRTCKPTCGTYSGIKGCACSCPGRISFG